jgi:hypothetical protein
VIEPLRVEVVLDYSVEHAFATWTERFSSWWPRGHSVSGDPAAVTLEPRVGGRIFERTRDGEEIDRRQRRRLERAPPVLRGRQQPYDSRRRMMSGTGTPEDPWVLKTPPGTSQHTMHCDDTADPAIPPLLEVLGLVELEHNPRNNRIRVP